MKSLGFLETQFSVPRKDSEKGHKVLNSTVNSGPKVVWNWRVVFPDRIVIRIGSYICWAAPRHVSSTYPSRNTDDSRSQSITSNAGIDI